MKERKISTAAVVGLFAVAAGLGGLQGCANSDSTDASESGKTGVFHGEAQGFGGLISADLTYENGTITDVALTGDDETPTVGGAALEELASQVLEAQSSEIDGVSGATFTSDGVREAVQNAIDSDGTEDTAGTGELTFTAGTYTGSGEGYNGTVALDVTFSETGIEDIQINSSSETNHIGTPAFDILFADAIEADGSGIDSVSGATFTSRAIKEALNDAAQQAGVSDISTFQKNTVVHEAQEDIVETYDVVVVGAGGAGMAAAVQSAQNGNSVLVIEENAEIGGNTIASGGQFQSAQDYLVWDASDPDATTGEYKGVTYDKVKSANGSIATLKTILNWNEDAFDPNYFADNDVEFVAGDIETLSQAGVHEEYLPTLQALKEEIQEYIDWAQPKLDAGENESDLTLFSTVNLHIFQTYYGGLRQSNDGSSWIYGDFDLVQQFVEGGQDLKGWLEDQGALFDESLQPTIVGALWQRENDFLGCDLDGDGEADDDNGSGKTKTVFNTYIATTENTLLNTVDNAADNKIITRTTAKSLITDGEKVTGVVAEMYDGTQVTAYANKGVILATGGYAANIQLVMDTNEYWADGAITSETETTNRSSLVGDGITMGEEVGAATTGMGYTQMMPISWVDNGDLAFGGGNYAIYISPTTGERFVNETSERDVLSLAEFANGVEYKGTQGTFIEIANSNQRIMGVYPYGTPTDEDLTLWESDVEDRQYTRTVDELGDLFAELGFDITTEQIRNTIEEYDMALINGEEDTLNVTKTGWTALIGECEKDENGNYIADTYTLDGVKLKIRLMAPSTHHTMGGLSVDVDRHVLDDSGNIIEGLYAAGEVTGGIHGGNRLGGNAIVEIFVSGRTAANAVSADNE